MEKILLSIIYNKFNYTGIKQGFILLYFGSLLIIECFNFNIIISLLLLIKCGFKSILIVCEIFQLSGENVNE